MSNFGFLTTSSANIFPHAVTEVFVRGNTASINILVDVAVRDVIHMRYRENGIPKGVYGVCTYSDMDAVFPSFSFDFDQNIYELFSDISQGDFLGIEVYREVEHHKVSYYSISTSVTRANYSEELRSYNVSLDHSLIIGNDGREFFGDFKEVIVSDKIIFADWCNYYAYGVSLDEDTYNNRYNKFRKSVSFNVAKK
jgi:hypothetical protein